MFLRKFIFPAVIVALAASTALGADPEKPTTKGDVTIQLPKGWPVTGGTGRSVLSALAPAVDKDATGQFQASFTITQDAGAKVDPAAQQKALAAQSGAVAQYQAVEKPTPTAAGAQQGVFFGGTFKHGTTELRSRQYVFVANHQIYTVTFTCLNSEWAKYQGAIEASVATLSVKH